MNAIEIARESVPVPSQLLVEDIDQQEQMVVIRVRSTQPPRCPTCTSDRVSYHSRYDRRLRDLPWQGRQVQLRLRTRRFRCRNSRLFRHRAHVIHRVARRNLPERSANVGAE